MSSSGGFTTTHAFGLNYSDKWGKKVDVSGSYFFNKGINNTEKIMGTHRSKEKTRRYLVRCGDGSD